MCVCGVEAVLERRESNPPSGCLEPQAIDMADGLSGWQSITAQPSSPAAGQTPPAEGAATAWAAIAAQASKTSSPATSEAAGVSVLAGLEQPPLAKKRGPKPAFLREIASSSSSRGQPLPSTKSTASPAALEGPQSEACTGIGQPADITVSLQGPLVTPAIRGRQGPTPLHAALAAAVAKAQVDEAELDPTVSTIADTYLQPLQYHLASNRTLHQLMSISATAFHSRLLRLASAIALWQQHARADLELKLSQALPLESRILYVDFSTYDETPLKVRMQEPMLAESNLRATPLIAQALSTEQGAVQQQRPSTVITKILQTNSAHAYLIRSSDGLLVLTGKYFHPLQSMARNNGASLFACLSSSSAVSPAADQFRRKLRSTCSDKAGYNRVGERLLARVVVLDGMCSYLIATSTPWQAATTRPLSSCSPCTSLV